MTTPSFDPAQYKEASHRQWQRAAQGWHAWMPVFSRWCASVTDRMLDLAGIGPGSRVLDIAAGDGDQSIRAAQRVGPEGYVLATDISANMLVYAADSARTAGLTQFETRVMDAEHLELEGSSFDAVISRFGLMLLPNVYQALSEIHPVLKPGSKVAAAVFSTPEKSPWLRFRPGLPENMRNFHPPSPANQAFSVSARPELSRGHSVKQGSGISRSMRSRRPFECLRSQSVAGSYETLLAPSMRCSPGWMKRGGSGPGWRLSRPCSSMKVHKDSSRRVR